MPTLNVPASSQNPTSQTPAAQTPPADDTASCRPPAVRVDPSDPAAPHDGDHNQGGARPAGLEYQRELGTEQDA
ncbi:hypothetical protein [Pararobbsia alpina]|nr:hypothetical protein [Pararobbsia alpina]